MCGRPCRAARDRKLARMRRRRELDDSRTDDRRRQQLRREALAKARAAPELPARNAPASASNPLDLPDKIIQFVDRSLDASRASLLRDLRREWLRLRANMATAAPVSRASLASQGADLTHESAAFLDTRHT